MSLLDTVEELMRDICEIDEPDDCDGVVRVKLDWLRPKVESLLSQCRKEALLSNRELANDIADMFKGKRQHGRAAGAMRVVHAIDDELRAIVANLIGDK